MFVSKVKDRIPIQKSSRAASRQVKKTLPAFTIIEMVLSLTFLTVLLLTLTILILHLTSIYQKGMAIRSVNAVGRELIDDFTRSLNAAPAKYVTRYCDSDYLNASGKNNCEANRAYKYYYTITVDTFSVNGSNQTLPIHGAICTGRYSYLWNSGYVINGTVNSNKRARLRANGVSLTNFRLLKIHDDDMEVCASRINSDYSSKDANNSDYLLPDGTDAVTELLPRSEDNLALYDLRLFPPVQHKTTLHTFNSATFILATASGGIDISASGDFCTDAPDNLNTDFNYCSINKFNFATRSDGELTTTEERRETYNTIRLR